MGRRKRRSRKKEDRQLALVQPLASWSPGALWELQRAARQDLERLPRKMERLGRSFLSLVRTLRLAERGDWDLHLGVRDGGRLMDVKVWGPEDGEDGLSFFCSCFEAEFRVCKHEATAVAFLARALEPLLEGTAPPPRPSRWKQTVAALDRALQTLDPEHWADQEVEAGARIAWRVRLHDGDIRVEVLQQSRRKRGSGFTPGRRIRPETLLEDEALWTRPEVRAVAEAIRSEGEAQRQMPYWMRRPTRQRDLSGGMVLPLLVGCSHVYLDGDLVDVVETEVGLGVAAGPNGGLVVQVLIGGSPFPGDVSISEDTRRLILLQPDTRRILLGSIGTGARFVLPRLQGSELSCPPAGRPALLERLSRLEPHLPLRIAPELVEDASADSRLHLCLEVAPGGLEAALRVRPAPGGPLYQPGIGKTVLTSVQGERWVRHARCLPDELSTALQVAESLGLEPAGDDFSWLLEADEGLDLLAGLEPEPPVDLVVEWSDGQRQSVAGTAGLQDLRVQVRRKRDWFGLEGEVDLDGARVALSAVLEALSGGSRYVPVDGIRWIQLSAELREQLSGLADSLHARRGRLEVDATAAPLVEGLLEEAGSAEADESWLEVRRRLRAAREVEVTPPAGLAATLRPYQEAGYAWLKRLATWGVGGILADDMGLGKTVQAIAILLDRASAGPALVVAPTSVGFNWVRELERFAPSLRPVRYRETEREGRLEVGPGEVVIISYDLARIDQDRLQEVCWETLVLDEAQQVKNSQTRTARALRGFQHSWCLALTGTPLENHLGELWSIFRLVSPGLLGSWAGFRDRFASPIERDRDEEKRRSLARLLQPFVLRRTKGEVLTDLPPRSEIEVQVELSPQERDHYERVRLASIASLTGATDDDEGRDRRFQVLAALTRLRQLACHPALVEPGYQGPSAKLESLLELIQELQQGEHRALVFSQFTSLLALVRQELDAGEVDYLYLDGSTPAKKREQLVDAFQSGAHPLFLISLKAGGRGLNLTAADYVIHLDPWWNPAVEDQATDRAHRIGQTRPVTVYRLVAAGTVEEQILSLHAEKRRLVEGVLDGTDRAGRLDTEQLLDLIRSGGKEKGQTERATRPEPAPEEPANIQADEDLGAVVAQLRERLALSRREAGELLGVSGATIYNWENARTVPSPENAGAIRKLVALEPQQLEQQLVLHV